MELDKIFSDNEGYQKDYSRIKCPVLKENCEKFDLVLQKHPHLFKSIFFGDEVLKQKAIQSLKDTDPAFLKIYTDISEQLQKDFLLSDSETDELIYILEGLALSYIGTVQIKMIRPMIKVVHSNFIDFNERLGGVLDGLENEIEEIELVIGILSINSEKTKEYTDAIKAPISARKKLKTLPEFIRQAPLSQATEFNKAAPPTNWSLDMWVETIYVSWFSILGRTIENSNDGKNGRKHLLEFLFTCIQPVHEAIEYETLDNTLRKVQNRFSNQGELSILDFKLGSSSPFGAIWRKSES